LRQIPTPEQERKKRRRELKIALAGVLVMAAVIAAEYKIVQSTEELPIAGHLLVFLLLAVVTLLLILVFFFLVRNLFKLVFERRRKVLGSHLKTRLTVALVALTIVPTIVLFIASAGVLHSTIESWFRAQVEDSLQSSLVIAQAYYQGASENVVNVATRLASLISEQALFRSSANDKLRRAMESWRAADGLASVQVHFANEAEPVMVKDPNLKTATIPTPRASFLKIGFQGEKTSKVLPLDSGGDLVRGVAPIKVQGESNVPAVVVVDHHIPTSLAGRLFAISNAFGEYQEAKRMRGPVKTMYVLILLIVALVIIFVGFWFGMTLARDITDPLERMAEATDKIATGDLNVFVEPAGDDELGVLVRSFNKMTEDLRASRDELVRVNLDLESRRKYMETVLKNVAAGVLALDPDETVTAANSSARKLLGITQAEVLGKSLGDVLPEASASAIGEILEHLEGSEAEAIERQMTLVFPDKTLSLICFANSLKDDEGRSLGVVLVFEDMTHLVKAQRMAAWRDVARRIAHEIKNPLTPIQLNAQRIRRKYMDALDGDTTVLDQCTAGIVDQVEQLKRMVNEFSKFARMPSANPASDDLNGVVREVVDLYAQGHERIVFSFRPDPTVPVFDLDREQMKRAVVNLLDNAAAAIEASGKVEVSTGYDPVLSMVSIEVADNGGGIAHRDRDHLFEPYFSTKPGGTGLGLTIVSTIVSDHNGFIRVKDNPGGGTRFIIELPVRRGSNIRPSKNG
jgi:two-component system nitrogen regulation sensor histidine kinase NtrY